MLGAFLAQDLILFVAFFDLMLIPFYFLVGSWGSGDRVRATIKMVIYTAVGSFLMLAAAVATGVLASSDHNTAINFTFSTLQHLPLSRTDQEWIFLGFAAAFLVKMPIAPFHGWMADAYKSMPIAAVAVFSGVVAKVASYGFLQIVLPLFPNASHHFQLPMLIIALVSIMWAHRDRLHDPRCATGHRLFERRADGIHPARHLLPAGRRRPGGAAADDQSRRRHRGIVLRHRRRRGPRGWQRESRVTWAARPSGRRCSRPCS